MVYPEMTTYLRHEAAGAYYRTANPAAFVPAGTLCAIYIRCVLSAAEAIAGTCVGLLMNIATTNLAVLSAA